jgi:hypothetical protein
VSLNSDQHFFPERRGRDRTYKLAPIDSAIAMKRLAKRESRIGSAPLEVDEVPFANNEASAVTMAGSESNDRVSEGAGAVPKRNEV